MENRLPSSDAITTAWRLGNKLVYKKLKNRYRIFCMNCQRYEYVSKDKFKQIQAAGICPMCLSSVKLTSILEHQLIKYIIEYGGDGYTEDNGFRIVINFKFGCKPKIFTEWVFRYDGTDAYARKIFCNMGYGFCYNEKLDWKKKVYANSYFWRFNTVDREHRQMTKREFIYNALWQCGYRDEDIDGLIKSNQKKIIIDNLLNGKQMEYIIAFDLKSYADVYKYRRYIKENSGVDIRRPLNIHYLDYLYRNNIKIRDFYDYMSQCRDLGFKLDKPTDFQHRHLVLSELLTQKRNKEADRKCAERYKELAERMYKSGKIRICAFKTGDEIRKCGKTLHNCIGSYVDKYANGTTDLFYLLDGKAVSVAIELNNGKVIQARADHNSKCPSNYMKHIRKWCKENDFAIAKA